MVQHGSLRAGQPLIFGPQDSGHSRGEGQKGELQGTTAAGLLDPRPPPQHTHATPMSPGLQQPLPLSPGTPQTRQMLAKQGSLQEVANSQLKPDNSSSGWLKTQTHSSYLPKQNSARRWVLFSSSRANAVSPSLFPKCKTYSSSPGTTRRHTFFLSVN